MRPTSPRPARRALLLPVLVLAACGSEPGPAPRQEDLLARTPDAVLEDVGRLVPDEETQWGGHGSAGWEERTRHDADGRAFVLASQREARLSLAATGPAERTLELDVRLVHPPHGGPGDEAPPTAQVHARLGRTVLGTAPVATTPSTVRFQVPAEAWHGGENELVLDLAAPGFPGPEGNPELALAEVRTGPARRATHEARGWTLEGEAGLDWVLDQDAGALVLGGEASGAGRLEIVRQRLEPRTGAVLGEERTELPGDRLGRVPLALASGRPTRLRLRWHADGGGARLLLASAALVERDAPPPPSIVLVSIDTLSAAHTSLYGYSRLTTPRLDAFAKDAIVFERCGTNAPWTLPSYMALFTGLYPSAVPMDFGREDHRFPATLPRDGLTLAEVLRARGYHTAGFIDAAHIGSRAGFDQGFDLFDESAAENDVRDPDGGIRWIVPRALAWIDGLADGRPFFLFVHAYDVHGPYLPDAPWKGRFSGGEDADQRTFFGSTQVAAFHSIPAYITDPAWPKGDVPDRVRVAPFADAYDEEILSLDDTLGRLFDGLRRRGVLDRSIVVFTADHGELTGQHDFFGHGMLWEEVLHVPLVVRLPGGAAERTGRRVADRVQLVDLYPTLVELTGKPYAEDEVHGRSLAPLLRGETSPARPCFSEGGVMRQSAVVLDGWKLIETDPRYETLPATMLTHPGLDAGWLREHAPFLLDTPVRTAGLIELAKRFPSDTAFLDSIRAALPGPILQLYDLREDPHELHDLAGKHPDEVRRLMDVLARARGLGARDARQGEPAPELSNEEMDRLRALGYADPGR